LWTRTRSRPRCRLARDERARRRWSPRTRTRARSSRSTAPGSLRRSLRERLLADLTDRQQETLKRAFALGYFKRPREATAAEIADELGISQSTFSEHVREAQRRLVGRVLSDAVDEPSRTGRGSR
jgi:predicted DNA binding protein